MDENSSRNRKLTLAQMINPDALAEDQQSPAAPPRRRLSLAEMLRESPITGGHVPLAEAVERARPTNRQAPPEQEPAPQATAPGDAPPVETRQVTVANDSAIDLRARGDSPQAPRPGVACAYNRYHLYARLEGKWMWQCDVRAANHGDALRQAIGCLRPEHDVLPIRLEQDETPAAG
jgi:hypothetical protein